MFELRIAMLLRSFGPAHVLAFTPVHEGQDVSLGVAQKDATRTRLPGREENVTHFGQKSHARTIRPSKDQGIVGTAHGVLNLVGELISPGVAT